MRSYLVHAGGTLAGNGWCAVEYTPGALDCEWKFRHENQLGSLIGVTNLAGNRIAEIDYGEYGQTYPKHILWDGPVDVAHTQGVAADVTRVYAQFGFGIPLDVVNGLVRCVHPGIDGHVSFGTVLNVGYDALLKQSYIDVEDLEGRVLNAITEYSCDLTILGNYGNVAPGTEPVTSGHWDDVVYDSLTDTTTFTDFSATFPPQAANWWLQPDAARSTYLEIVSLSASQVVVEGDATSLAHGLTPQPGPPPLPDIIGTFYTIVWPAGVDPATGTLAHNNPCEPTSRLLFAGYYYMPPVAGTMIQPPTGGTGPHGQQPGGNHHGDYYCWNRVYAQKTGRWTTTDPAMSPVHNLQAYCSSSPLALVDSSGLQNGPPPEIKDRPGLGNPQPNRPLRGNPWLRKPPYDNLTATAYDHQSFRSGAGACDGEWTTGDFKTGEWENQSGTMISGLVVELKFTLPARCCCSDVRLLQVTRASKQLSNGTWTDNHRRPVSEYTTNDDNTGVLGGHHVDEPKGTGAAENDGWYGGFSSSRVKGGANLPASEAGRSSGPFGSAWMRLRDWPGGAVSDLKGIKKYQFAAEVCAVCATGQNAGTVYSCFRWGYEASYNARSSGVDYEVQKPTVSKNSSATFKSAVTNWNNSHGANPLPGIRN